MLLRVAASAAAFAEVSALWTGREIARIAGDPVAVVAAGDADVGVVAFDAALGDGIVIGAIPARGDVTRGHLLVCRYADGPSRLVLLPLHDFASAVRVLAERAFALAWRGDSARCDVRFVGDGRVEVRCVAGDVTVVRIVDADEAEDTARALAASGLDLPEHGAAPG